MIEVEGLTKYYGPHPAIMDVSFNVKAGEVVAFLGPNGAGKTTCVRILTGFMHASAGTARITGFDIREQSLHPRRSVDYVPEHAALYRGIRVRQYFRYMNKLRARRRQDVKAPDAVEEAYAAADAVIALLRGVLNGDDEHPIDVRDRRNTALDRRGLGDRASHVVSAQRRNYRSRVATDLLLCRTGLTRSLSHEIGRLLNSPPRDRDAMYPKYGPAAQRVAGNSSRCAAATSCRSQSGDRMIDGVVYPVAGREEARGRVAVSRPANEGRSPCVRFMVRAGRLFSHVSWLRSGEQTTFVPRVLAGAIAGKRIAESRDGHTEALTSIPALDASIAAWGSPADLPWLCERGGK